MARSAHQLRPRSRAVVVVRPVIRRTPVVAVQRRMAGAVQAKRLALVAGTPDEVVRVVVAAQKGDAVVAEAAVGVDSRRTFRPNSSIPI